MHEQDGRSSAASKRSPGNADALSLPPRRDAHDDESSGLDRLYQRLWRRLDEDRLGVDADDALYGQCCVGKQPARIAPIAARTGFGPDKLERTTRP